MKLFTALLLGLALLTPVISAEEWLDFSTRDTSMGGAGGVLGRGATGAYYNPANAVRRPHEGSAFARMEFDFPVTAMVGIQGNSFQRIFDTVADANDLLDRFSDGAFDIANNALQLKDIAFLFDVFDALDSLKELDGQGLYIGTSAGMAVRVSDTITARDGFALTFGGFGIAAFSSIVDLESLRGYRLADETAAPWEQLLDLAILNSGLPSGVPTSAGGIAFSTRLQTMAGYSALQADALAKMAEDSGLNFGGQAADILFDFLDNSRNDNGSISLESGANPLDGNNSGFLIRGLAYYEVGLSYSLGLPVEGLEDWLAMGITVKFIQAYTFSQLLRISDMSSNGIEDALRNLQDKILDAYQLKSDAERTNVGIDLGLIFTPQAEYVDTMVVSLVARNINGPEFAWNRTLAREPKFVRFEPQFRAGISWTVGGPVHNVIFAFEADLNRVSSDVLPRYHTQFIRAAVAYEPNFDGFAIGLRLGMLKNLADADQAITMTAGLGFRAYVVSIEFGGQYGLHTQDFGTSTDFEAIPQRFAGSVTFGIMFDF